MKKVIITIIGIFLFNIAYSLDITANTDWYPSTIPTFTGDLIIKNGVTLNIHAGCTLIMSSNSKIIIERNAKLIVDNSIIKGGVNTNNQPIMWKGIVCNNGSSSVINTDRVPYLKITNSTIRDADLAFSNHYTDANNNTYSGGAIVAWNVVFKECLTFIDIQDYEYYQKSLEYCVFTKCQFKETSVCGLGSKYILLKNVKNVYFRGCYFENSCAATSTYAIMAYDSKFSLRGYYSQMNKFVGFGNGIFVLNNSTDDKVPVLISDCEFTPQPSLNAYNKSPIALNGCLNVRVISNKFTIKSNTGNLYKTAIALDDCKSFTIEENDISFINSDSYTIGIYVSNSGVITNQIYKNTINNATIGIQADGKNRGQINDPTLANQGLKFLCNTFTNFSNTSYYFKVTNCNNSNSDYGVSFWQQGALKNSQGTIAGSPCFNSTPDRLLSTSADNDFYDEHTTVGSNWDVKYYYPTNPVDYTVRYVSKDSISGIDKIKREKDINSSNTTPHCESRLPCVGIHCPVVMGPMTINVAFPQIVSVKSQLNQLVNAGDHDVLYNLVLNVSASNVSDVYNELLNSTPSLDILSLASGNDLFTPSMIENILVTNSYGIKSESVRNALESRDTKLSDQQMDNIYQAAESISPYEDLLMQTDVINQEYTSLMNQSLSALQGRYIIPMDSIKMYLEAFNDLWSNIRLIHIAFTENNNAHAQELFNDLSSITEEVDELNDYNLLYNNVLLDIYTNHEGDFSQMTTSQRNDLYSIYTNGSYAAGIAKYLLIKYDDLQWEPNYCESNSGNSERRANPLELETISDVEIYPNPANNTLTIELPSCDKCQTIYRIYDLSGRKVLENTITGSKNIISVSELSAGTYFIQLVSNNKTTTQKLIITK